MDFSTFAGLLDDLRLPTYPQDETASSYMGQRYSTDIQGRPLDLSSFMSGGYDPVNAPQIKLGMNPNDLSPAMMPYQGAPEGDALSILAQGGSIQNSNIKGFNYGGRAGTELPLSDDMRLALGLQGVSTDVSFGQGQPYGGRFNRADITGIDATLRDLANNREYGAEVKKDFTGNPFVSGFFRQRF
jgi:hypothetical protein